MGYQDGFDGLCGLVGELWREFGDRNSSSDSECREFEFECGSDVRGRVVGVVK